MAKKQTFGDKAKKGTVDFKVAKLVYTVKSDKTNAFKFVEKNVRIPNGENDTDVLKKAMAGQGN
jgi:stress response protein SCP2